MPEPVAHAVDGVFLWHSDCPRLGTGWRLVVAHSRGSKWLALIAVATLRTSRVLIEDWERDCAKALVKPAEVPREGIARTLNANARRRGLHGPARDLVRALAATLRMPSVPAAVAAVAGAQSRPATAAL